MFRRPIPLSHVLWVSHLFGVDQLPLIGPHGESKVGSTYMVECVPIFLAWIISPVFTGIISGLMMLAMRTFILRRHNNNLLAIFTLPVSLFITSWINIFFI